MDSLNQTATAGTQRPHARPHVIVIGNEKGGTGKSTTAMHMVVGLLKLGYRVGSIDVDGRQGTLSTYIDNRTAYAQRHGASLVMPEHRRIAPAEDELRDQETADDGARFIKAISELSRQQVIVIDTPGSESHLTRLAHNEADTLITPLNDSFVDIDVLAKVDRERRAVQAPSVYTQMVWEQNNRRVVEGRAPIDWVVMRNRMTHIDARNKRDIVSLLDKLAARIGFRLAPGFGERMVYRELFLRGLTLIDLEPGDEGYTESPSHAAARREVTALLAAVGVPIGA